MGARGAKTTLGRWRERGAEILVERLQQFECTIVKIPYAKPSGPLMRTLYLEAQSTHSPLTCTYQSFDNEDNSI